MRGNAQVVRQPPLVAGLLIGWLLLWWHGSAFVLSDDFSGYGWPGYVINAWSAYHRVDAGYDAFRQPLHGWLLGGLGELLGSYPHAAVVLSSASAGALVLSAGLIAGRLAGPWAGGLAAATLPMVANNAHAATAANHYPLQSGLAGLGVATALLATDPARRGWLAGLAGLIAGLAIAVDGRMALFAAVGAVLLLASARPLRILWFVLLLGVGPRLGDRLVLPSQPMMSVEMALTLQRPVLLRWARDSRDPELVAACADEPPDALPSLAGLQTPCARAMFRYNRLRIFPRQAPFGLPITAGALLLGLIPLGLRSRRLDGLAALWLLGAVTPLLVQGLWVPYPDRYLLPWAVSVATIVPIALARLPLGRLAPLAFVAAGLWVWEADPTTRAEPLLHQRSEVYIRRREARPIVQRRIGDAPFLDCSGLFVSVSLLPRLTTPRPPMFKVDPRRCAGWLADAEPGAWLATRGAADALSQAARSAGWTQAYTSRDLLLWQRPAP